MLKIPQYFNLLIILLCELTCRVAVDAESHRRPRRRLTEDASYRRVQEIRLDYIINLQNYPPLISVYLSWSEYKTFMMRLPGKNLFHAWWTFVLELRSGRSLLKLDVQLLLGQTWEEHLLGRKQPLFIAFFNRYMLI